MRALILLALLLPAIASAASVSIKWDPNSEPDLSGYVVHRSVDESPFVPVAQTTAIGHTFHNVSSGKKYRVAVTARNTSGIESGFSNIVIYSVPSTPSSLMLIVNQLVIK